MSENRSKLTAETSGKREYKNRTISTAGVQGKSVLKERYCHRFCRKIREAYKVRLEKPYYSSYSVLLKEENKSDLTWKACVLRLSQQDLSTFHQLLSKLLTRHRTGIKLRTHNQFSIVLNRSYLNHMAADSGQSYIW